MKLTISLAQMNVIIGDVEANLKKAAAWTAEAARRGSDLVVFPEMWTTGFDYDNFPQLVAKQTETATQIAGLARQHKIWINGSMLMPDLNGKPSNTSILFDSQGRQAGVYRKVHLFRLMNEHQHMTPGRRLANVETRWGNFGLSICYDLRFAEMFRTYALNGVNLVLLPAQWPHPRLAHWRTLLRARAIENQLFMVAVNRVGHDELGHFFGHSAIIGPWGNAIMEGGETELLLTATIDPGQVETVRQKIPVFQDRRPDLYQLD